MKKQFFGNDHSISLEEAKKMIKKFRDEKDKIVKDEHRGKHLLPNCESFDRTAFDALLRREDCKGVRIYYGMKETSHIHAVIVGIDADGKDILPVAGAAMDSIDPPIIDKGLPCPDHCPDTSDLNP
jgi:hypothetical protein